MRIGGLLINYYFICKRKLWFYVNKITMENTSDFVGIGKYVENLYKENLGYNKKIIIDETISPDYLKKSKDYIIVLEIKKSSKVLEAAKWQLKYYLWYLEQKGIKARGKLVFPEENEEKFIELTEEDKVRIKEIIEEIKKILRLDRPPKPLKTRICKTCAYRVLCF